MANCDRCHYPRFQWRDDVQRIVCLQCGSPLPRTYQQWRIVTEGDSRYVDLSIQAEPDLDAPSLASTRISYEFYEVSIDYRSTTNYRRHLNFDSHDLRALLSLRIVLLAQSSQLEHAFGRRFYYNRIPILASLLSWERRDPATRLVFRLDDSTCHQVEQHQEEHRRVVKIVTSVLADRRLADECVSPWIEDRVDARIFGNEEFVNEIVTRRRPNPEYWEGVRVMRPDTAHIVREPTTPSRPASCINCRNYHGQHQVVCGIHPYGWTDGDCPDKS